VTAKISRAISGVLEIGIEVGKLGLVVCVMSAFYVLLIMGPLLYFR
jgi:hypothetical protein